MFNSYLYVYQSVPLFFRRSSTWFKIIWLWKYGSTIWKIEISPKMLIQTSEIRMTTTEKWIWVKSENGGSHIFMGKIGNWENWVVFLYKLKYLQSYINGVHIPKYYSRNILGIWVSGYQHRDHRATKDRWLPLSKRSPWRFEVWGCHSRCFLFYVYCITLYPLVI